MKDHEHFPGESVRNFHQILQKEVSLCLAVNTAMGEGEGGTNRESSTETYIYYHM